MSNTHRKNMFDILCLLHDYKIPVFYGIHWCQQKPFGCSLFISLLLSCYIIRGTKFYEYIKWYWTIKNNHFPTVLDRNTYLIAMLHFSDLSIDGY